MNPLQAILTRNQVNIDISLLFLSKLRSVGHNRIVLVIQKQDPVWWNGSDDGSDLTAALLLMLFYFALLHLISCLLEVTRILVFGIFKRFGSGGGKLQHDCAHLFNIKLKGNFHVPTLDVQFFYTAIQINHDLW